eukprot:scaffold6744_cov29-Tisochrysis_lutea.AAC.1
MVDRGRQIRAGGRTGAAEWERPSPSAARASFSPNSHHDNFNSPMAHAQPNNGMGGWESESRRV